MPKLFGSSFHRSFSFILPELPLSHLISPRGFFRSPHSSPLTFCLLLFSSSMFCLNMKAPFISARVKSPQSIKKMVISDCLVHNLNNVLYLLNKWMSLKKSKIRKNNAIYVIVSILRVEATYHKTEKNILRYNVHNFHLWRKEWSITNEVSFWSLLIITLSYECNHI